MYRRARERFPDDEEIRRESEAYGERRERSTERDEYGDDSYSDEGDEAGYDEDEGDAEENEER